MKLDDEYCFAVRNANKVNIVNPTLRWNNLGGKAESRAELRKSGNTGSEAISIVYNSGDGSTRTIQFIDENGRPSIPLIPSPGSAIGSARQPVFVDSYGSIRPCTSFQIISISDESHGTDQYAVQVGKSYSFSWNLDPVPNAKGYVVIPYAATWGAIVESCVLTGTTVVTSVVGTLEQHTIFVRYKIIAYA